MGYRHAKLIVIAGLLAPFGLADQATKGEPTAGQIVNDMLAEIAAFDVRACTARNPVMKAEYDRALVTFRATTKAILERLLSKDQFAPLRYEPAPPELVASQKARSNALAEKLKRGEGPKDCRIILATFRNPDEARMEPDIANILSAVRDAIESKRTTSK